MYINETNNRKDMQDSENRDGIVFGVDTNIWTEPFKHLFTNELGWFHLHSAYYRNRILVFAAKNDNKESVIPCGDYLLFPQNDWYEVTRVKGKNKGKPLEVYKNGSVWTSSPEKFIRVFVKKEGI